MMNYNEQEPCEDAVSRQAVKDIIHKYKNDSECLISWVMDSICDLPSVTSTQETRWISCSERLPKESITVLGTTRFDDIYNTELYDDCGEKKWYADGDFDVPIVAWMPLPEPYIDRR